MGFNCKKALILDFLLAQEWREQTHLNWLVNKGREVEFMLFKMQRGLWLNKALNHSSQGAWAPISGWAFPIPVVGPLPPLIHQASCFKQQNGDLEHTQYHCLEDSSLLMQGICFKVHRTKVLSKKNPSSNSTLYKNLKSHWLPIWHIS